MGTQWRCSGGLMGTQWGHKRDTAGMQWGCSGDTMRMRWGHGGDAVGLGWDLLVTFPPAPQPPTPEADYPELSPDELEPCPEEDGSPPGSYRWGAAPCPPPRWHQELAVSPRWDGAPGEREAHGTETVWGQGGGKGGGWG